MHTNESKKRKEEKKKRERIGHYDGNKNGLVTTRVELATSRHQPMSSENDLIIHTIGVSNDISTTL